MENVQIPISIDRPARHVICGVDHFPSISKTVQVGKRKRPIQILDDERIMKRGTDTSGNITCEFTEKHEDSIPIFQRSVDIEKNPIETDVASSNSTDRSCSSSLIRFGVNCRESKSAEILSSVNQEKHETITSGVNDENVAQIDVAGNNIMQPDAVVERDVTSDYIIPQYVVYDGMNCHAKSFFSASFSVQSDSLCQSSPDDHSSPSQRVDFLSAMSAAAEELMMTNCPMFAGEEVVEPHFEETEMLEFTGSRGGSVQECFVECECDKDPIATSGTETSHDQQRSLQGPCGDIVKEAQETSVCGPQDFISSRTRRKLRDQEEDRPQSSRSSQSSAALISNPKEGKEAVAVAVRMIRGHVCNENKLTKFIAYFKIKGVVSIDRTGTPNYCILHFLSLQRAEALVHVLLNQRSGVKGFPGKKDPLHFQLLRAGEQLRVEPDQPSQLVTKSSHAGGEYGSNHPNDIPILSTVQTPLLQLLDRTSPDSDFAFNHPQQGTTRRFTPVLHHAKSENEVGEKCTRTTGVVVELIYAIKARQVYNYVKELKIEGLVRVDVSVSYRCTVYFSSMEYARIFVSTLANRPVGTRRFPGTQKTKSIPRHYIVEERDVDLNESEIGSSSESASRDAPLDSEPSTRISNMDTGGSTGQEQHSHQQQENGLSSPLQPSNKSTRGGGWMELVMNEFLG